MAGNTRALQGSSAGVRRWPFAGLGQRLAADSGVMAAQLLVGLVILGGWELSAGTLIDTFFVSKPSLIAAELWRQATTGTLWRDLWVTIVQETLVGYAAGATLGIVLGFMLAQTPVAARILNPYLIAINGVPRIALAPLFIIWFGIGLTSKIWLAGMMAFFLAFFNTFAGVGGVEHGHLNVARVMGARRLDIITKVVLPSASPWIITGLRLAIPYALVAAVVGEMVMSTAGIGFRIIHATQTFDITGTMSGVIVLMLIVMLFNWLLDRFEARLMRWRPPAHEPEASSQG